MLDIYIYIYIVTFYTCYAFMIYNFIVVNLTIVLL